MKAQGRLEVRGAEMARGEAGGSGVGMHFLGETQSAILDLGSLLVSSQGNIWDMVTFYYIFSPEKSMCCIR